MREVIRLDAAEMAQEKPVQLLYIANGLSGWEDLSDGFTIRFDKLVYLGHCQYDGDMFAGYNGREIAIYKGHLNSGKF